MMDYSSVRESLLSAEGKQLFEPALQLWTDWNSRINVVSRKDIDNLYEHHVLHSLAIAEYLARKYQAGAGASSSGVSSSGASSSGVSSSGEAAGALGAADRAWQGASFLDVGTGGGFPGIPLAMVLPQARFTLCDSVGKKITVASAVAEGLGLGNVQCVNARVETLNTQFDYVVSRAVTDLATFYPWVRGHFGRSILYLKGGDVNAEISDLCRKCRLDPHKISVWPISEWLDDEYFAEKFVIEIRK